MTTFDARTEVAGRIAKLMREREAMARRHRRETNEARSFAVYDRTTLRRNHAAEMRQIDARIDAASAE